LNSTTFYIWTNIKKYHKKILVYKFTIIINKRLK